MSQGAGEAGECVREGVRKAGEFLSEAGRE